MNSPHFDIQIERKAKLSLARTLSLSIPAQPSGSPRRSPRTTTNLKIYCALCLSPLLGGPVRPAPSEFDGGVLALVRIWHGMKGTGRRLHPFTPSSNCGILQLTLQDVKRSPCVTPDVTTRQQLRLYSYGSSRSGRIMREESENDQFHLRPSPLSSAPHEARTL